MPREVRSLQSIAVDGAVALAIGAIGFFWLFRAWLFTEFDGIFGGQGDARLLIAILEHWHRVFTGLSDDWRSPGYFFPTPDALGRTDAFFLYGLVYSVLREIGLDPFNAFMGVIATLAVCGYAGFIALAVRHFGLSVPLAAAGAFLFAFSNMMTFKLGHAQMYCAMLLPFVLDLIATALRTTKRFRAILLAAAAGLLHALIFFTAYLNAWFFAVTTGIALIIYAILARPAALRFVGSCSIKRPCVPIGYLAGFGIGIVPFLLVYVPILLQGHRYHFDAVRFYAPRFSDIIAAGGGNFVWNTTLTKLDVLRNSVETDLGFTPVLFAAGATYMAVLLRRRWVGDPLDERDRAFLALGLTIACLFLLQLEYFGLRPWRILWETVPGAKGVRVTFRSQIVLNLAAALLLAGALSDLGRRLGRFGRRASAVVAFSALALMVEQLSRSPRVFSRAEQTAWLAAVPPFPSGCHVFYLLPAGSQVPWFVHQSDAMLVAMLRGIPTLNGNASVWPHGWSLGDIAVPGYLQSVRDWIAISKLGEGVCGLNPREGRWVEQGP